MKQLLVKNCQKATLSFLISFDQIQLLRESSGSKYFMSNSQMANYKTWIALVIALVISRPRSTHNTKVLHCTTSTNILCEIGHYGKSLISIFKESFASIDKIFFLGGTPGH